MPFHISQYAKNNSLFYKRMRRSEISFTVPWNGWLITLSVITESPSSLKYKSTSFCNLFKLALTFDRGEISLFFWKSSTPVQSLQKWESFPPSRKLIRFLLLFTRQAILSLIEAFSASSFQVIREKKGEKTKWNLEVSV